jgi:hypothetical protein
MNTVMNIPNQSIILFGHSLGSAPSIKLASDAKFRDINSIILLSPIVSGLKFFNKDLKLEKSNEYEKIDVFPNFIRISEIHCPIFLIHGHRDNMIPVKQVIEMGKSIRALYQWYPSDGDHNNILIKYRCKFFTKCKMFFDYVKFFKNSQNTNKSFSSKNLSFRFEESYIAYEPLKNLQKICPDSKINKDSKLGTNQEANKGRASEIIESSDEFGRNSIRPLIMRLSPISDVDLRDSATIDERKSCCGNFGNTSQIEHDYIQFKKKMNSID